MKKYLETRKSFIERFKKITAGDTFEEIAIKAMGDRTFTNIIRSCFDNELMADARVLRNIADAYGVTTDYLLGRTEEKEPAQAEAGQALTGNYNTNSISHSEDVVKSLEPFLSLAVAMAERKHEEITVTITDSKWNKWMMRIRKLDREDAPC